MDCALFSLSNRHGLYYFQSSHALQLWQHWSSRPIRCVIVAAAAFQHHGHRHLNTPINLCRNGVSRVTPVSASNDEPVHAVITRYPQDDIYQPTYHAHSKPSQPMHSKNPRETPPPSLVPPPYSSKRSFDASGTPHVDGLHRSLHMPVPFCIL